MTTMTTPAAGTQPRPAQTSDTAHGGTDAASTGTARTCTATTHGVTAPGVTTHGATTRGVTRGVTAHGAATHSTTADCTESCTCGAVDRAPRSAGGGLAAAGRRRWETVVAPGKDAGMATAEYAIAMIAAVGFAGLLVAVLTSATVRELLTGLVTSALSYG
ncbi:hypothetical protein Sked_33330 [Sanguibacter keddieii DSM 10542]|uniref:DUF4244 domain-containing protein n=1 Tax=Sanguibacter keddieii (strain ATCC 51767 / DSM 10542 / NCFB 3025 / ST-74) TaxID=446469 RepID=D1BE07_SANKS|nr:hypothetical protein Sked_33330 [Sanguibacter keddieii DSM 10542]